MNGQVVGSLTSNFFEFYDLNYVENDTSLIDLSHLHQKISRLTNSGKNSAF